jgi:uncharacterized protein (TIGR02996 family)
VVSAGAALFQEVLDRPDDDVPRLVYADWLDDHGDAERADFIRTQCALARLPEGAPGRVELARREAELLHAHGLRWAEPLRPLASEVAFERGFVDFVSIEEMWQPGGLARLPELFRLAPVRALHLECDEEVAAGLLAVPDEVARLRYLDLFDLEGVAAQDLRRLLTTPCLANLTTLFIDNEFTDDFPQRALAAVGRSPALSRLKELGLAIGTTPGDLDGEVVRAVARSPYLRLEKLYLVYPALGPSEARALGRSESLRGLTDLWLDHCQPAPAVWEALLRPGAFPQLERVLLHDIELEDDLRARLQARWALTVDPERDTFFPQKSGIRLGVAPQT